MKARKNQWRKYVKARVKALTADEKQQRALRLTHRLLSNEHFLQSDHILLFASLPDEIDLSALIQQAHEMGKNVYLPVVHGDDLLVKRYDPQNMAIGAFAISEPQGEQVDASVLQLVVVPGVAFDAHGNRLGRGKGYYDRLLSRISAYTIGVGFAEQYYLKLPAESHDITLQQVVVV